MNAPTSTSVHGNGSSTSSRRQRYPDDLRCRYCQRGYSKSEHLARHERSHTGHKPYVCKHCSKAFGRQDSLARHVKLHTAHEASSPSRSSRPPISDAVENGIQPDKPPFDNNGPLTLIDASPAASHLSGSAIYPGALQPPNAQPSPTNQDPPPINTALHWPDSEELLQFLMSDSSAWPIALPMMQTSPFSEDEILSGYGNAIGPTTNRDGTVVERGHQAMQQVNQLIKDLSSNLTDEINHTGITSEFLETCMNMFLSRFIPALPVLHRPTFVTRNCSHPLLLNMIALGSLFVAAPDAICKGEALWRLAHTAVATSWQGMMTYCGPGDNCAGVQLVLAALLGQTYAILSKNKHIRMTSDIFHGLGFCWARSCGMYHDRSGPLRVPALDAPSAEKDETWRIWIAGEIQRRAILGHYVLDGLIAQSSGHPTSVQHITNSLVLPMNESVFEARTADEWISAMDRENPKMMKFREVFAYLFDPAQTSPLPALSAISIRVVLEGLQSLVSQNWEAGGHAVGTPSKSEIIKALLKLYEHHIQSMQASHSQPSVERLYVLLRWHVVCINVDVDTTVLAQEICLSYGISQTLYGIARSPNSGFDMKTWSDSIEAQRALLHAIAIQEIVEQIPVGKAQAMHIPLCIFAAASVYVAISYIRSPRLAVPAVSNWREIWHEGSPLATQDQFRHSNPEINAFLMGNFVAPNAGPNMRNLLCDINVLQILLTSTCSMWGITYEMTNIMNQWVTMLSAIK